MLPKNCAFPIRIIFLRVFPCGAAVFGIKNRFSSLSLNWHSFVLLFSQKTMCIRHKYFTFYSPSFVSFESLAWFLKFSSNMKLSTLSALSSGNSRRLPSYSAVIKKNIRKFHLPYHQRTHTRVLFF